MNTNDLKCSAQNFKCPRELNLSMQDKEYYEHLKLKGFNVLFYCEYHKAINSFTDTEIRNKIEELGLTKELYRSNLNPNTFLFNHLRDIDHTQSTYINYTRALQNKISKFKKALKK